MNNVTAAEINEFKTATELRYSSLDHYQTLATRSAFYPGKGTPLGLAYCTLKLNGEAGELAEHVGRAMRDDALGPKATVHARNSTSGVRRSVSYESGKDELTPERREFILKEIGDCLWYLAALCSELGTTLSAVALGNLRKIAGRTERGTLSGSGDDR